MFTDNLTARDMELLKDPNVPECVKTQIMIGRSQKPAALSFVGENVREPEPPKSKVILSPFNGDCAAAYYGYEQSKQTSAWSSLRNYIGTQEFLVCDATENKRPSDYEMCVALRYLGIMTHEQFMNLDLSTNKRHLDAVRGMIQQIIALRGQVKTPVVSLFMEYPGRADDIARIGEMRREGSIDGAVTETDFFLHFDAMSAQYGISDEKYPEFIKGVLKNTSEGYVPPYSVKHDADESEQVPTNAVAEQPTDEGGKDDDEPEITEVNLLEELDKLGTEDDEAGETAQRPTERQAAEFIDSLVQKNEAMNEKRKGDFIGVYDKDPKAWEQVIAYYRMINSEKDLGDREIVELILLKEPDMTPERWMKENSDYNVPELPEPKSLPGEADDDFYMWFSENYDGKLSINGGWTSDIIPAVRELVGNFAEGLDDNRIAAGILANPHLGAISLEYVQLLNKYRLSKDPHYRNAIKSLCSTCLYMQEFRILPIDSKRTISLFCQQNGIKTTDDVYIAAMSLKNEKTFTERLNSFPDPDSSSAYEDDGEPSPIAQEEEAPTVRKEDLADYNITPWNLLSDDQNWRIIAYDTQQSDAAQEDLSKRFGESGWDRDDYIEALKQMYATPDEYWKYVFGEDYFTDKHGDETWKIYYRDNEWMSEDADYADDDVEDDDE